MEQNRIDVFIDKNAISDDGNGTIRFKSGLTLSDESIQKNGTRYDMNSMDISTYSGKLFADHDYSTQGVIGRAFGVAKRAKRLVAEGFTFAVKQSALANFNYEMMRNGWLTDVSIGTIGDFEESDGDVVFKNARLVDISVVGIGNNDNAHTAALNAFEYAKSNKLDTKDLEDYLAKNNLDVHKPEKPNNNIKENNMSDEDKAKAEAEAKAKAEAEAKVVADKAVEAEKAENAKKESEAEAFKNAINDAIAKATKPLEDKLAEVEKNAFDKGASEPEFVLSKNTATRVTNSSFDTELNAMSWEEVTGLQVQNFWKGFKQGDQEAVKTLRKINEHNLAGLKKDGIVKNTLTIADFGNFVTNPELVTEIQGYRSDFSELLRAFNYQETNSIRMAWTSRTGDINMEPVEFCDDGSDGNLKPISEYTLAPHTKDLEELAAVTPVCNAATIFLAVDLIQDVTQGYRTDYDRKLAQGIIGALERALETNAANSQIGYSSGGIDTAAERLENFRKAIFSISQGNGVLVMNEATYGQIWGDLVATGNGGALTSTIQGGLTTQMLWGKGFVIVPNELMPTITDTATAAPAWTLDGTTVTVNHAVMYVNPANFRGRQNGGLRFDLSTEAAYEVDGTVYSAYQRNEIVLRGSMFRGTAVLDPTRVRGVRALDVIS